jgi:glycosyltransferase involved in cell wall biosynthesis
MSHELKQQLSKRFAPDVKRLSEMLDVNLSHWSRFGDAETAHHRQLTASAGVN